MPGIETAKSGLEKGEKNSEFQINDKVYDVANFFVVARVYDTTVVSCRCVLKSPKIDHSMRNITTSIYGY